MVKTVLKAQKKKNAGGNKLNSIAALLSGLVETVQQLKSESCSQLIVEYLIVP